MNDSKKWKDCVVTGGWVSPPHEKIGGTNYIDDKQYATVKECGLDYLFTMYENPKAYGEGKIMQALDLAEKYGIECLVCDYRIVDCDDSERKAIVQKYTAKKAFAGFNLFDEPGIARFEELDKLRIKIRDIDSDCLCYINLLPMYAFSSILKGTYREGDTDVATLEEYRVYLDEFLRRYDAQILSYDFYPFRFSYGVYDENYFTQMHEARIRAQKAGIPFWTFIQLTAWAKDIPLLSCEEIRWQVHTSLAGGAAGIMYFTYWTPMNSDVEQYRGALMTADGKKGDSFDTVKRLNSFIARIGALLRKYPYRGLIVPSSLSGKVPPQNTRLSKKMQLQHGDDILIGMYGDDIHMILYAVNVSFKEKRAFSIDFGTMKSVRIHTVYDVQERKSTMFSDEIEKGDAVLLEIE